METRFQKLKLSLIYLNNNLLFILSTFLIAFIPLFPKIPLFDILPGYIVRIRLEDFLVLFTAIIWFRDAFFQKNKTKQRFNWNTTFLWFVLAYAGVGLTSILLATTLLQTIPAQLLHIGKSSLHFFRYLEYFSLFFFMYSSVKTKKQLKIILATLVFTLIAVVAYGYGQEYMHFPLYSTMNREYSKGQKLYLQENARPQSTFAGHYDLAAYLVIILPIIFAISINSIKKPKKNITTISTSTLIKKSKRNVTSSIPVKENKTILTFINNRKNNLFKFLSTGETLKTLLLKIFLHLTHLAGAWMLITSGSKTALAAYLVGILTVLFFYLKKLKNFRQQLKWGSIALTIIIITTVLAITFFGKETENSFLSIAQKNTTASKIISKIPFIGDSIKDSELLIQPDRSRPEDLYGNGHEFAVKIIKDKQGNEIKTIVAHKSTWSKNALKYGISMGIRLDTLWPQAIKGLINNPLFGNGYATLNKLGNGEFTEADGTDNNFLRTLGETGLLGFITFYGLIIFILIQTYANTKNKDPLIATINTGFTASIIGILINASYIDVFAASKVAFVFWALAGFTIKSSFLKRKPTTKNNLKDNLFARNVLKHLKKHYLFYFSFLLLFFLLHKNPYKEQSLIKNFDTSNQAIENVISAKCYLKTGSFSVCRNNGLVLKNNLNIYSILLVPFLKIYSQPTTFYYLNFVLIVLSFIIIYKLTLRIVENNSTKNSILTKSVFLISAIFIYYFSRLTSQPLTNYNLFSLFLLIPIIVFTLNYAVTKQKKLLAKTLQILIILIISLTLLKSNVINDIKTNFRNNKQSYKIMNTNRINIHFKNKVVANKTQDNYLITNENPYYLDLYKNDSYKILPLSNKQPYFNQAQKVWLNLELFNNKIDLIKTYQKILAKDNAKLYISDFNIPNSNSEKNLTKNYSEKFNDIKKIFDLSYEVIDCNEQCNIYNVKKAKKRISAIPKTINNKKFDLNKLNSAYTFSVYDDRFTLDENFINSTRNTKTLVADLNSAGLKNKQQDFMIYVGDTNRTIRSSYEKYFNTNFGSYNKYPIIYTPATYHKFFSKNDYFLFLSLDKNSKIDPKQKLFVYNAFLELEKLPEIKNIFIIANNLNWQNDWDNENNFIYNLETKLSEFPELNKYIITENHIDTLAENLNSKELKKLYKTNYFYNENPLTKTHYFGYNENIATYLASYIQFSVGQNSVVNFKEIKFNPRNKVY